MKPGVARSIFLCGVGLALYALCRTEPVLARCLPHFPPGPAHFLFFFLTLIVMGFFWESHEWKKLIMVHHWPPTVCKEVQSNCSDPPDYWTIHGLWPDKGEACNRTWHFDYREILDLLPDLKIYWPDVLHHSPNCTTFWKHEWDKHGTCAAQLDILNSEKKYFGKSLELYRQLSLNSVLRKLGIKPSTNYYEVADIKDALASVYGVVPKVQCLPPAQNEKVQIIGQIELCLTKELQLRNCSEPGDPAPLQARVRRESHHLHVCEDGPVFYPPPEDTPH
ncbi:PREDICTED: ribonuclease T2 [Elephantulus edwardii]|uniref:ribonuclease T2 n=1 Tax=Elephantulus edwardii TaxID=28737 RepID=UPI0003F06618|nr:PREDICTED: ribonuclease T2 [Elephantulus edwardii]